MSVGVNERLDFALGKLYTLIAQLGQRLERLTEELPAQFLISDDLTDQQLDGFLGHRAYLAGSKATVDPHPSLLGTRVIPL